MKALSLFTLFAACLCSSALADAQTLRQYAFPNITGLKTPALPEEVNIQNEWQRLSLSMKERDMDNFLRGLALPPVFENSEQVVKEKEVKEIRTPQCLELKIGTAAELKLVASDKTWLKKQKLNCRLKRKLGRKCEPLRGADIVSVAALTVPHYGDQSSEKRVTEVPESECKTTPSLDTQEFRRVVLCANNTNLECHEEARRLLDGIPLVKEGPNWVARLRIQNERQEKTAIGYKFIQQEEWVEKKRLVTRTLKELKLGSGITLTRVPSDLENYYTQEWKNILELVDTYPEGLKNPELEVVATYQIQSEGGSLNEIRVEKAELPLEAHQYEFRGVKNLPSRLSLNPKDALGLEVFRKDGFERSKIGLMHQLCQKIGSSELTELGRFVCSMDQQEMQETLGRHTQVRILFMDSDGTQRFVTWEQKPWASYCSVSAPSYYYPKGTFKCSEFDVQAWGADPASPLLRIFHDPSYTDGGVVQFKLKAFLPKAEGAQPLKDVVRAQTSSFELQKRRN